MCNEDQQHSLQQIQTTAAIAYSSCSLQQPTVAIACITYMAFGGNILQQVRPTAAIAHSRSLSKKLTRYLVGTVIYSKRDGER